MDFFFVLDGDIEIFDLDEDGQPNVFTVHGERQFTGELDLFNDRQILVSGRTGVDSRVVRVERPDFRRLVSGEPDIAEIIMRAFILRRVGLIRHTHGGVVLIGPGHGGDTLRLQRFLMRNGYPHRLLDTPYRPIIQSAGRPLRPAAARRRRRDRRRRLCALSSRRDGRHRLLGRHSAGDAAGRDRNGGERSTLDYGLTRTMSARRPGSTARWRASPG